MDFAALVGTQVFARVSGEVVGPRILNDAEPNIWIKVNGTDKTVLYGHTNSPLPIGTQVTPDISIGTLASNQGDSHLHLAVVDETLTTQGFPRVNNPLSFFKNDVQNLFANQNYYNSDHNAFSMKSFAIVDTNLPFAVPYWDNSNDGNNSIEWNQ